ncbi:MAG: NUDIX hydrolase [Bacteriovoracaceae bacterium]
MVKKWETKSEKFISQSKVFKRYEVNRVSLDSGKEGTFDVVKSLDWVNIVGLTKDNKVILVEQYRHGTDCITWELPGGAANKGEDLFNAAKREFCEETGYTSDQWEFLGSVDVNPAFMTNKCEMYLAKNCVLSEKQNLDHFEEIDILEVDLKEIPQLIEQRKINHSLVIAAFYFLFQKLGP